MDSTVIVAAVSCLGTVIGSMFGVIASSNKTIYRIEQLEKKVEKHNGMVERMIQAEDKIKSHQYQINDLKERIDHI